MSTALEQEQQELRTYERLAGQVYVTLGAIPGTSQHATDGACLFMLGALLLSQRPKVIVEAGTFLGHFAHLAGHLLPDSRIYTADPNMRLLKKHHPEFPPNVSTFDGDFMDMLAIVSAPIDFAYLDSGDLTVIVKDLNGVSLDGTTANNPTEDVRVDHYTQLCLGTWMAPNSLIVNHDMNQAGKEWPGGQLIKEQAGLVLTVGRGLSVEQVP